MGPAAQWCAMNIFGKHLENFNDICELIKKNKGKGNSHQCSTIYTERAICPTVQHPVTARATPKRAINRSRTHKKSPVSSAFVRFGVGDEAEVGCGGERRRRRRRQARCGCFLSNYRSPARLPFTLRRPQSAAQITRNRLRIYLDSESNRMAGQGDRQADRQADP